MSCPLANFGGLGVARADYESTSIGERGGVWVSLVARTSPNLCIGKPTLFKKCLCATRQVLAGPGNDRAWLAQKVPATQMRVVELQEIVVPALRRVPGVLSLQRVVCGCNKEFKLICLFAGEKVKNMGKEATCLPSLILIESFMKTPPPRLNPACFLH